MANLDYAFTEPDDDNEDERNSKLNLLSHLKGMQVELESCIPGCAELTLAIRKLQEFQFWTQEAIGVGGLRKVLFEDKQ